MGTVVPNTFTAYRWGIDLAPPAGLSANSQVFSESRPGEYLCYDGASSVSVHNQGTTIRDQRGDAPIDMTCPFEPSLGPILTGPTYWRALDGPR